MKALPQHMRDQAFQLVADGLSYTAAAKRVDDVFDEERQVRYIGKAWLQTDGKWRCLGDVSGSLCIVEAELTFDVDTLRSLAHGLGPDREAAIALLKAGVV